MAQVKFSPREVISIGDLVADIIVSVPHLPAMPGEHQLAREIQLEPGGAANFLIMMARLGYPVTTIGVLGDDTWGHQIAALVAGEGVDMSLVRHSGTTTTVVVVVGSGGDHVFLGKYGVGPEMTLDISAVERIKGAGAIYCAGYTLREERLTNMVLTAIEYAKEHDVPVCFDPGPHIAEVPVNVRDTLLPLVDVLLITTDEIPLMIESGGLDALMQMGPHTVIEKKDRHGCAVYTNRQPVAVANIPGHSVPVVDSSAAGDSFNAAFIVAQMHGWDVVESARLANLTGAVKVQKLGGGRNVPTLGEVQEAAIVLNVELPQNISYWLKG
jgi:ribokinase